MIGVVLGAATANERERLGEEGLRAAEEIPSRPGIAAGAVGGELITPSGERIQVTAASAIDGPFWIAGPIDLKVSPLTTADDVIGTVDIHTPHGSVPLGLVASVDYPIAGLVSGETH